MAPRISPHPDRLRHSPATTRSAVLARPVGAPGSRSGLRSRAEEALAHGQAPPPAPEIDRRRTDPTFELARHLWLEEELFFRVVRDAIDETDFMDLETVDREPREERNGPSLRVLRPEA